MTIKALYPNVRPALDLNFARTRALDPRITFTRASTGTFVGSDGLIKTAANNIPRFEHDSLTGESLGLLIEEARTNIWTNSNSSTSWGSLANTTIVSTSELAPDGSLTGFKVALNSGQSGDQNNARLTRFIDVTRANNSTLSLFVKFAGIDIVRLYHGDGVANMNDATGMQYTFSTNAVVRINGNTGGGYTVSAQKFANGWVRLSVNRPNDSGVGPIRNQVSLTFTSAATGNGTDGVAVWGVDLQDGPLFPTSYIPTSGATATRAADVVQITGDNFLNWYNQSQGTFVHSGRFVGDVVGGTYGNTNALLFRVFNSGLNTFTNQWWAGGSRISGPSFPMGISAGLFNGSTLYVVDSAAQQFNVPVGSKINVAMFIDNSTNFIGTAFNGQSVNTAGITSSPTWNILSLSESYAGNTRCGTVSRLTYYPTRLSNAQLQVLTS
jgi:hypothetical protein